MKKIIKSPSGAAALFFVVFILLLNVQATALENFDEANRNKPKIPFRDSLDHAFDLSEWVLEYNGFIPIFSFITEPALGGFGVVLAPLFIHQNRPYEIDGKKYPAPPTIYGAGAGYTLNHTWFAAGAGTGYIPKYRIKYTAFAGYGDANMDYYFTTPIRQETKKLGFNFQGLFAGFHIGRVFKNPKFSTELEYAYVNADVRLQNTEELPVWNKLIDDGLVKSIDVQNTISKAGLRFSYDTRDNIFTPNKGIKTYVDFQVSNEYIGSDFDFEQLETALYWYLPLTSKWVNGFRFDLQQAFDDIPFYMKPFLDMRGVPTMRFQGSTTILAELEERWDVYRRWSAVFFGGVGTAFNDWHKFSDGEWTGSGGVGFRYLIARKLSMRCGMDLAYGTEGFAYYIVFGSAWMRQ